MALIEPRHYSSLTHALTSLFGESVRILKRRQITGGDINDAYELTLTDGAHVFMKSNSSVNEDFFAAEASGLLAIAQTGAVGTPKILGFGSEPGYSFLLMEFIGRARPVKNYWEIFARGLAAMHRADTSDLTAGGSYGFLHDNYIGSGRQINTPHKSWISFFRDCRLRPQFEHASHYFDTANRRRMEQLLDTLGNILTEPDRPSLLHGDLWSGNVVTGTDGRAWLIDPAVSVGHAEADIAMTELFGGFPQAFYAAYQEAFPMQPDYEYRRDLYNLYHLLNHLNLFGRSYLAPVQRILAEYVP